jgi:hypothetical protein
MTIPTKDAMLAAARPKPLAFDLEKMKRWFGMPPLLHGQEEKNFDEFVLSLTTCVEHGDQVIMVLLYRYAVEQFKRFQLLGLKSNIIPWTLRQRKLTEKLDEQRESNRHSSSDEIITAYMDDYTTAMVLLDHGNEDLRVNFHYKHRLDEINAASDFFLSIRSQARFDDLVDECATRANDILQQMRIHDEFIAQRLDEAFTDFLNETALGTFKTPAPDPSNDQAKD